MAASPSPIVPASLLSEILSWRCEGAIDMDVITRLHQRTVPIGYNPHPWKPGKFTMTILMIIVNFNYVIGKKEDRTDMLRSILAQMEYQYWVREWDEGVPFRTYMYVPEVHHITQPFLERMVMFSRCVCMYTLLCVYYNIIRTL